MLAVEVVAHMLPLMPQMVVPAVEVAADLSLEPKAQVAQMAALMARVEKVEPAVLIQEEVEEVARITVPSPGGIDLAALEAQVS
jgi:hypothetical protein